MSRISRNRFATVFLLLFLGGCTSEPAEPGWKTGFADYPVDGATGIRELTLADDASHLPGEPGSHEFWNFFAFDPETGLSLSLIFLSADMWNVDYRQATYAFREGPGQDGKPEPGDYFLLQLNVSRGTEKVFSTMRNPPETSAEFSTDEPAGRIGFSTFAGTEEDGVKVFQVHIDAPDLSNVLRLEAEVEFRAASPGFAVDGRGIFGKIPGGSLHHWEWPLGYPRTSGSVRITDREGSVVLSESIQDGGGYTDHMWGEGMMADMLDSWYFGRLDLGAEGAIIYIWLAPRSEAVEPYGRVFRIPRGGLAQIREVTAFSGLTPGRSNYGLEYFGDFALALKGGGEVRVRFGDPAGEDWPFQVAGPASISVSLPGDVTVTDQPGIGEYLWQPGIDSEAFAAMFDLLQAFPWAE